MDLFAMKLHEQINITNDLAVVRVPGGWLYTFWESAPNSGVTTTFVPFCDEFHPTKKNPTSGDGIVYKNFCTIEGVEDDK